MQINTDFSAQQNFKSRLFIDKKSIGEAHSPIVAKKIIANAEEIAHLIKNDGKNDSFKLRTVFHKMNPIESLEKFEKAHITSTEKKIASVEKDISEAAMVENKSYKNVILDMMQMVNNKLPKFSNNQEGFLAFLKATQK